MIYCTRVFILILCALTTFACSRGPADISETEWRCFKQNNQRICSVSFVAKNHSHLPAESSIRIRAHRRQSVMGSDAVQNIVVADKLLHETLNPGEVRHFNDSITPNSGVTNIVVTIVSKEK